VIYLICIRVPILIAIHLDRVGFYLQGVRLLYTGASYSYWYVFEMNKMTKLLKVKLLWYYALS